MAGSWYSGSYAGVGEMLNADFMVAEMGRRGEKVAAQCVATAPVYEGRAWRDDHRGRYKANFELQVMDHGGYHSDRAAAYIWNTAPEAIYVEYKDGHHTMRNALLTAAGD